VGRVLPLFLLPLALALVLAGCGGGNTATSSSAGTSQATSFHPVAGDFEPNDRTLAECKPDQSDYYPCLEQAYGNLAYNEGAKPALARFAADIAADPAVERGCHRIAHTIGSATLARDNNNVGQAFAEGDSTCWSGYYHGILERALKGATEETVLVARLRDLCSDVLAGPDRFIAYQCVHGLGHGLMIRSGLDLPYSLKMCTRLETDWEQVSCDGGVFMENFNTSYGVKSRFLKEDQPLYPCTAVEERHKLYCYLQITDNILALNGYDLPAAAKTCLDAETDWVATCFQSVGRSASGMSRNNQAKLLSYCSAAPAVGVGECIYGAVRDITSNDAGGQRALRYCNAVKEPYRARCFYGLGTIMHDLDGLAICARVPAQYQPNCRLRNTGLANIS
jgi:hypothetical protein